MIYIFFFFVPSGDKYPRFVSHVPTYYYRWDTGETNDPNMPRLLDQKHFTFYVDGQKKYATNKIMIGCRTGWGGELVYYVENSSWGIKGWQMRRLKGLVTVEYPPLPEWEMKWHRKTQRKNQNSKPSSPKSP